MKKDLQMPISIVKLPLKVLTRQFTVKARQGSVIVLQEP